MKRTLLLLCALMSLGGNRAWATTPATGAYPVEGKTYYLYAVQSSGARSYLYSNDGTLTVSQGTCSPTAAYQWTVTVSDGVYTISNVAGKKLNVANYLTLDETGASFNLGKDVAEDAFVSLYATYLSNSRWYVTPSSGTTFPNNYYLSSYSTSSSWSASYVFEDVDAVKYGFSAYLGTFYDSGGTVITSSNTEDKYAQSWVSKSASAVTFKNSAGNNINVRNGYFFPGQSGSSYTISCSPTHRITG